MYKVELKEKKQVPDWFSGGWQYPVILRPNLDTGSMYLIEIGDQRISIVVDPDYQDCPQVTIHNFERKEEE